MPYKDGVETLTEIKQNNAYNDIPVIIFSTSQNTNHIDVCYKIGATFYIIKPETFDAISKVVEKVFHMNWKISYTQPPRQSFVLNH